MIPEEVWYIGDNYACDVEGARNAGLYPVWYVGAADRPHYGEVSQVQEQKSVQDAKPVLTIHHWKELEEIIKNNYKKAFT